MPFPTIPDITPSINTPGEEIANLLLSSIAFEELGLAHFINSEAEKIQLGQAPLDPLAMTPLILGSLVSVKQSAFDILRTTLKQQMLLQDKLEDVFAYKCPTTTTATTTTMSTTTTTTTTTMVPVCAPGLTFAVFASNNLNIASQSVINAGLQVNGNMAVSHNVNTFLGTANVVGSFTDYGGNIYQNLVLNAAPVPFKVFNPECLQSSAYIVINGNVTLSSSADAAIIQGKTLWVKGSVSVTGENISLTGGGILATGGITVSGVNFTYTSTGCFALYSQTGDIIINNGPYAITGLIYTAEDGGDIHLAASQGGLVCGAVVSGRDIIFSGGNAVHAVTNMGAGNPCLLCSSLCPG